MGKLWTFVFGGLLLLLLSVGTISAVQCDGIFDIVLTVDSSNSITADDFTKAKTFCKKLVDSFKVSADRTHFGVYDFAGSIGWLYHQKWVANITGDKSVIVNAIDTMPKFDSATDVYTALKNSVAGFATHGRPEAQNWIVVITDANQNTQSIDKLKAVAEQARKDGIVIFAIGAGDTDIPLLTSMASEPHKYHYFKLNGYADLDSILPDLIDYSCTQIISVTPNEFCVGVEGQILNVTGRGYADMPNLKCRFGGEEGEVVNAKFVNMTHLECEIPKYNTIGDYKVDVSLDGTSYQSTGIIVRIVPCPNVVGVVGGVLGSMAFLATALLAGLLYKRHQRIKAAELAQTGEGTSAIAAGGTAGVIPAALPPKKWTRPNVEYLWPGIGQGGGGGIRPVIVEWGESGAPKRQATQEEIENGVAEDSTQHDYVKADEPVEEGCWGKTKAWFNKTCPCGKK